MISIVVISIASIVGAGAMIRSHFKTIHESVSLVKQHQPDYQMNKHHTFVHNFVENFKK